MDPSQDKYSYVFSGFADSPRKLEVVALHHGLDEPTIVPGLLPKFVLSESIDMAISGTEGTNGFVLGLYHPDIKEPNILETNYLSTLNCGRNGCTLYLKNSGGAMDTSCAFKLKESSSKEPELTVKCPGSQATYVISQEPDHSFEIVVQKQQENKGFMSKKFSSPIEFFIGSLIPVDTPSTGYKILPVFGRMPEDSFGRHMVMILNLIAAQLLHYGAEETSE